METIQQPCARTQTQIPTSLEIPYWERRRGFKTVPRPAAEIAADIVTRGLVYRWEGSRGLFDTQGSKLSLRRLPLGYLRPGQARAIRWELGLLAPYRTIKDAAQEAATALDLHVDRVGAVELHVGGTEITLSNARAFKRACNERGLFFPTSLNRWIFEQAAYEARWILKPVQETPKASGSQ